jgi:eukaryotic translation initiation factor 2-alpha kinase 3
MIPSLSGNLYKFDGKFVEPVPINANHLLKNSFRYSEDLVISGGRETMTYGVDLESGNVIYECTLKGCERNFTGQDNESQQVLVVMKLLNDPNSECHFSGADKLDDLTIRVVVPDGLVCAVSKTNPSVVVWKHKVQLKNNFLQNALI